MNRDSLLLKPRFYTLSTVIIAFILIGDLSANQQNALGNWLMTIGQILEGNASFQQTIEEYLKGYTYNINSQKYKKGGSPIMDNEPLLDYFRNTDDGQRVIKELQKEIKELQKKLDKLTKDN